jgi:hypothetical protein
MSLTGILLGLINIATVVAILVLVGYVIPLFLSVLRRLPQAPQNRRE